MKENDENIKFCKKLETVALGCHLKVNDEIRSIFKEYEIESYQCVEFILNTPLSKTSALNNVQVFYPFLFRLINYLPFIYEIKKENDTFIVTTIAKTKDKLNDLKDEIRQPSQLMGHKIAEEAFNTWKNSSCNPLPIKNEKFMENEKLLTENTKRIITE